MVADFSIAAIVRSNPALGGKALAIGASLAPHAGARRRFAAPAGTWNSRRDDDRAGAGDLLRSGRGPSLPAAESSAHSALLDAVESVSPVVESGAPGCVWLDLAGMDRIFDDEDEVTAELARRARVGMDAAAAIASSKEVALLAARCGGMR